MLRILLLFFLLNLTHASAQELLEFETKEQEQQFKELTEELRCPVCQNQNLADSGAGLADDLREEIYNQVLAGNNNKEIVDFMVMRYGDFIIYRPQLKPMNYFLWFGPILFLLIGLAVIYKQSKSRKSAALELTDDEKKELNILINKIDNDN